jgi:glutaredoxin-like protein NrdH
LSRDIKIVYLILTRSENSGVQANFNIGKERDMTDKPIKLYTLSTCSHCKSTKKFLNECTVQYEFVDVDLLEGDERKAIIEDIKKLNPRCSFPTLIIGDEVIVGFKEKKIKEALGL